MIDIPLSPATVTEHQVFAHWCSHCRKRVFPRLHLAPLVLGHHRLSLKLMSYIATLREQERKPFAEIQNHLRLFYRLQLSLGEIIEVCHEVAARSQPVYQKLRQILQDSPVVHGDETGWRENGINGYVWNFNTPQVK